MSRIRDGDTVKLVKPCRVDGYWYDAQYAPRGCWDQLYLLPGNVGRVIRAQTPCVTYAPKREPAFFANVDVDYLGATYRVRVFHDSLQLQRKHS